MRRHLSDLKGRFSRHCSHTHAYVCTAVQTRRFMSTHLFRRTQGCVSPAPRGSPLVEGARPHVEACHAVTEASPGRRGYSAALGELVLRQLADLILIYNYVERLQF